MKTLNPVNIPLLVTTLLLLLISGCETFPTKSKPSSEKAATGDVKGVPLVVEKSEVRCSKPFNANLKKYGHMSSKRKKRLQYDYVYAIRNKIVGQWNKPASVTSTHCKVRITQRADGCIKHVHFQNCPDQRMKKTVFTAIQSASPLPKAPHPELFDTKISLTFKTNDNTAPKTQKN